MAASLRHCHVTRAFAARAPENHRQGVGLISASHKPPSPIEGLSFEAALKELEGIVARLERGDVDLEDSILLYERGQALKLHCESKLKTAEGRLEKIVLGAGGPVLGGVVETA